jgi:hypothetical protein
MTERERFDAYWLARQRARGYGDRLTDAEMLAHPDRREDEFHAWQAARAGSTEAQAEITDDQIVSAIQDAGFNLAFRNFEDDIKLARALLALRAPRQALTDERITAHTLLAMDCPPQSQVMLVQSIRRILGILPASEKP